MQQDKPAVRFTLYFGFLSAISALALIIERHQSGILVLSVFTAFFCYFWLTRTPNVGHFYLGLAARLLFFFSLPILSDDVYRFIWDGRLLAAGVSPFESLPADQLDRGIAGIDQSLYTRLNSPDYFSVYPPLNQLIFLFAAKVGGDSLLASANTIRLLLLLADLAIFGLIQYGIKTGSLRGSVVWLYWLNPLVIIEGVGNLHFEMFVVLGLVIGLVTIRKNQFLAGVGFGLAIGAKLLPLIYLPVLFFHKRIGKNWRTIATACLIATISILPLLNETFLSGMQNSLGLYFQKFEFNASIYFLAREVGFWHYGYNAIATIGPILSFMTILIILILSIQAWRREWPLSKTMLFSLSAYLILATTVHPWYIIPLVFLGLMAGYNYPLVWSFMIFLTYVGYTESGFELSIGWVVFEYVVVIGFFVFETFFKTDEESFKL